MGLEYVEVPPISTTFDDSLIFCKANSPTFLLLLKFLNIYARASGQFINTNKTTRVFSKNVGEVDKDTIAMIWGCGSTQKYEKYLGLPSIVGRSRRRAFLDIKTKLWQ